ncbi:MAG: hypothetical protein HY917_03520 [Candidatus Diapherotrites archaeon]|nr:hypothetical protein [Candidatus Diapherotrites archaeon]
MAALVTVVIFAIVFSVVNLQESSMRNQLSQDITALYEDQQANKILQAYLGTLDPDTCVIFEKQISRQLNRIYDLFFRLESLQEKTFVTSSDPVKRQYLLASMSLWIDLQNASKYCSMNIKPVLYFFPNQKECALCDAMVTQFESLKKECPSVRIFAFPAQSDEFEFSELLKKQYGVSSAPAMVVKNRVLYEIVPMEQLKSLAGCT